MRATVTALSSTAKGALAVAAVVGVVAAGTQTNWLGLSGNSTNTATPTGTVTGTGSNSSAVQGQANGNGNGNTNGNPPSKSFVIRGSLTGLAPGIMIELHLTVDNANNQDIKVTGLSAMVASVTKAAGAPSGTCATNSLSIAPWTGSAFTAKKNTDDTAAGGYIPVTMQSSAPGACQGARYVLTYTGTGVQP